MGKDQLKIKVQNVVATSHLAPSLDLFALNKALHSRAKYDPETFPGLVYKLKAPKATALIFKSGKLVCTGANSILNANRAIGIVHDRLVRAGFELYKHPEVMVRNIVATSDLDVSLNLSKLVVTLGMENVEYNPEQFPGLVYRVHDPRVVSLIFSNGKLVMVGAKTEEDLLLALVKIRTELSNDGFL